MPRTRGAAFGTVRAAAALIALAALPLAAEDFWPGAHYDPRIPTVHQVLGYEPGEQITTSAGVVRYLEALAAASSRIQIFPYGESWEGRKLVYAVIGSEANIHKMAALRSEIHRFADPHQTTEPEAQKLRATLPAVVWLSYGVHGDEISPAEAALVTAYHLLAARNDPMVEAILANDLVLIDPLGNPDGHDHFVNYYQETRGPEPDANPLAAEHNEPWPGSRFNHYLFDLNRDWIALTQPEVRGMVKVLREWLPLVTVDFHEMNSDASYFFSPEADPYNPNLTAAQRDSLVLFARNNARWFDRYGFDYFTREVYDAFYPGYGAGWPAYYGAVAMTYEQSSARGLVMARKDGTPLTFRETIRHHFVASLATLEAAAQNREKLLADFYRYRASAIEEGSTEPVKAYILPRGRDGAATDKLAGILLDHGIEVERAAAAFQAGSRSYPAGTYVVPLAQAAKRLIRTLLDEQTPLDHSFVAAEKARRKRAEPSALYDITAWSLPLLFNVEAVPAPQVQKGRLERLPDARLAGAIHNSRAAVAYLVPWGSQAAARLLATALRRDLKVATTGRALTQDGREYPAGTLIFKVKDNAAGLAEKLAALAHETGADIYGADSGWVDDGANFGSGSVLTMRKPAIALAWDSPANAAAAGATRFVLERQYNYPVTPIRTMQLASDDLASFNVLILPPGGDYAEWLGEKGIEHLKSWVNAGGTLIALGAAIDSLTGPETDLLSIAREGALPAGAEDQHGVSEEHAETSGPAPATEISSDAQYEQAIRAGSGAADPAAGAIVRARIQAGHWLSAGMGETVNVMVAGQAIYTPIKADKGVNVAYFETADKLLASGQLWSENRRQMAYKPLVVNQPYGRGNVVAFTADPNFRAMQDGMNLLFLNAVFRGPAHAAQATER